MREIKCRSWISSIQKFVYFENGNYSWKKKIDNVQVFNWDNAQQYTGLKDKNGVPIYEGDILISDKVDSSKNKWIGVVEDNGFGWLALKYKEYINPSWLGALSSPINEPQQASWVMDTCEVIGNVDENKELLETK
jgi:uncharacterized phage protein (TIGR01671 family)